MTRVAFTLFGGNGWTGGLNYLRNLLSAVSETAGVDIHPVLFVAPETPHASLAPLLPWLSEPPVVVQGWSSRRTVRMNRLVGTAVTQCDRVTLAAYRHHGIDASFQHGAWYGTNFPIPTVGWIADFQHRHLPQMFPWTTRLKRTVGYELLGRCVEVVMVSSDDAARDCARFFPGTRGRIEVVPFAVRIDEQALAVEPRAVADHHGLPARFIFMPNQLWRHKNHLTVVEALHLLKRRGLSVVVAATGNPRDSRNPDHPAAVLARVREAGLEDEFRFLGLVPYADIVPLMRASIAVLNPSLFEGWSTTVEEAKALGMPLLLSDLAVHREQTKAHPARYFAPHSAEALADLLAQAWQRPVTPVAAPLPAYAARRGAFARQFESVVATAVARANPIST